MHMIRSAIAGTLALFVASAAVAQTFPTVASQSVIGRLGVPGTTGPSQAIPFATLSAQLFSLEPSQLYDVSHYGALPGNTATANTTTIGTVEALTGAPRPMYVPPGRYNTNFTPYQVTNQKYLGPGQLKMSGFAQAAQRAFILNPQPIPSTDRAKMFDGLCAYQFDCQYSFVGSGTTATQAGGYQNFVELAPNVRISESGAGFNSGTAGVGPNRSGQFQNVNKAYFSGGGDYTINFMAGEMFGSCPVGATHFLACPALGLTGGGLGPTAASANGGYLQGKEVIFNDLAGASMAAINDVINMNRTQSSTTLGQVWGGYRIQSNGTVPIDWGYTVSGTVKSAFDTTPTNLGTNKIAVAIKANDRIYLGASSTPDSQGVQWYADTPGTEWITSAANSIGIYAKGFNSFSVQSVSATAVNNITAIGQTAGNAPQFVAGGSDTNIGIQLASKGTGQAYFTNASGFILVPSGNDTLLAGALAQTVTNKVIDGASNTISNVPAGSLSGTTLKSTVVNSSLANAAAAFTAGALVTATDHITVNGYINSTGGIISGGAFRSTPQSLASLGACGAGQEGQVAAVNDSSVNTWGATVAAGGSNKILAYCNGAAWTVAAK